MKCMNAKLFVFFSGFPTRHFTDSIAEVLKKELEVRDRIPGRNSYLQRWH